MSATVNDSSPEHADRSVIADCRLEPFDETMAPLISGWIQNDVESRWIAPYTIPPITPDKMLGWQKERQTAFVFESVSGTPLAYGELVRAVLDPREVWIAHIIVDPAQRGIGVGRAFTIALANRAFNGFHAGQVYLSVFRDNPIAKSCYDRCGFRQFKSRPVRTALGEMGFTMLDMRIDRFGWTARRWMRRLDQACAGVDWKSHFADYCAMRHESDPVLEEKLELILNKFEKEPGAEFAAADFGSGPGLAAEAILRRFPNAHVTAYDSNPLYALMGDAALGQTYGKRIEFDLADLRECDWLDGRQGAFELCLSTLATHWMSSKSLRQLYRSISAALTPGGMWANADHFGEDGRGVGSKTEKILQTIIPAKRKKARRIGAWSRFWEDLKDRLGIAALCEEMEAELDVYEGHEPGFPTGYHSETLQHMGFDAAEEIWRKRGDAVVVARKSSESSSSSQ